MAKKVLTYHLSEPLSGTGAAKIDINTVDGNLSVHALPGGTELINGTLQYLEKQDPPTCDVNTDGRSTRLTVKSSKKGQPWIHLPWATCNGATDWKIYLNPTIPLEIMAHSGGGNIRLNLSELMVTRLTADTSGGNLDVILPEYTADLKVSIKSGAGNVTVHLPGNIPTRIQATTGLGNVVVDEAFPQIEKATYQSPDFEKAVEKVEIIASSGAGNVLIKKMAPVALQAERV